MMRQPHPLTEEGLPYVPEEFWQYGGDWDTHHLYWPRAAYLGKSIVHRTFRDLQTVEMPRTGHVRLHNEFEPPAMPTLDFMIGFVQSSGLHVPRRLARELRGRHG